MEKRGAQLVFFTLVLGGCLNLSAGNVEDCIVYLSGPKSNEELERLAKGKVEQDRLAIEKCQRLRESFSPSEFGVRIRPSQRRREKTPPAVVPDKNDGEEDFFDAPVITPSQEMAGALSKFVLLDAATEDFRVAERVLGTPSPVKRTRIDRLLEDLAEEARRNPEQLQILLQADSEKMSHLRKLLARCDERGVADSSETVRKRESNSFLKKRRSFHGATSDLDSIATQSSQLRRSESLDRGVTAPA